MRNLADLAASTSISRRVVLASAAGTVAAACLGDADAAPAETPWIWDCHTHLAGVTGTAAERAKQLLEAAERLSIERLVVFMGTHWSADPDPADLRRQNDDVLAALAAAPDRLFGFVYLNPKYPAESLAEIERCVAHGPMVGVKLWIAASCDTPAIDPLVRRAVELMVPILQHAYFRLGGNRPGESSPSDVAALARRHPEARFIAAHTGGDWEQGIRAIRELPNVYAETSGFDPTSGMVEMAVRELGAPRVLFGSDAGGRSFASQLAKVESADLPAADRRRVLRGNLEALLAPALRTKEAQR